MKQNTISVGQENFLNQMAKRKVGDNQHLQDDLLQIGYMALCEALEKFDPKMGISFLDYAYAVVDNAMSKGCIDTLPRSSVGMTWTSFETSKNN